MGPAHSHSTQLRPPSPLPGKLILLNLEKLDTAERCALADASFRDPASLAKLPLAERWIVSKVHEEVDRITDCNEKYDFGEAGRALYDLFWGEFADWYLEASKTRLYGAPFAAGLCSRRARHSFSRGD